MFTNTTSLARAFALRRELFNDIIKKYISTISSTPNNNAFINKKNNLLKSNAIKWSRISRHNNQRALSTLQRKFLPQTSTMTIASKEERVEFMDIFPEIIKDLTDTGKNSEIPEAYEWYAKVLQQNVPNSNKIRGLTVVAAYKMLEDPNKLTPENIRLANILGWCVEMIEGYYLMVDDLMDSSETRRGKPCWYKRVGMIAVNDSYLIQSGIFRLLKTHFSHLPMYIPAMELIHDVDYIFLMGQASDTPFLKDVGSNLGTFTMERYKTIVKYKTSPFCFHLPIALGMFLANKFDPEMHRQLNTLVSELGEFFQIQNDFFDCFGDPEKTGKIGTDIQEGKCSWPVVVALQRATSSQKKVIEENYGKQDPVATSAIKELYEELGLRNTYAIYTEDTYNLIRTHIQQLTKDLPHVLFIKILDELYKSEI